MLLKRRGQRIEWTYANTRQALDTVSLAVNNLSRLLVIYPQGARGAVGNTMPAVRTAIFVACNTFAAVIDGDVKRFYEGQSTFDILFSSRNIQHKITLLLRGDLRTIHVHHEIVIFH